MYGRSEGPMGIVHPRGDVIEEYFGNPPTPEDRQALADSVDGYTDEMAVLRAETMEDCDPEYGRDLDGEDDRDDT